MPRTSIRQGEIYWLDDCPPLDGDRAKRRPVVVINPANQLRSPRVIVLVIAVTSSLVRAGEEDIALPNLSTDPAATTGLDKPCWAVVRWSIAIVDRTRLSERAGYVSGATLKRILLAFGRFIESGGRPVATLP